MIIRSQSLTSLPIGDLALPWTDRILNLYAKVLNGPHAIRSCSGVRTYNRVILLDFYFKYMNILCMYMYYIDDSTSVRMIVLFPFFFKDVVLVYLYYMYKRYHLNIYLFLFLFKKYYKITKDPKTLSKHAQVCQRQPPSHLTQHTLCTYESY